MTESQLQELIRLRDAMRQVAAPVGLQHAWWDWISDLDALRVGTIEQRLSGIEARLVDAETAQQKRLERIEKRLELSD